MQQFGNGHFSLPSSERSADRHESVLDAAVLELHGEAVRHRLHVARQRLRERRGSNTRLVYDQALAWVEKIERGD